MKLKSLVSLSIFLCVPAIATHAQNTIGGLKLEVSQAEVDRQSEFLNAEKFRMLGKYDQAVEAYTEFLYHNETSDAAWYGLARCQFALKSYGAALQSIDNAIKNQPDNRWYYLLKADIFEKNGQIVQAANVYDDLAKRFPKTPEFLERLAYLSILSENPKRGLKALDELESITGISETTATKKHLVYVALGDQKKAANELKRLADAIPSNLNYRRSLARFYEETGDKNNAQATWKKILELNPDDSEARLALLEKKKNDSDAEYLQSLVPLFQNPTNHIDNKIKELAPYLTKINPNASPELLQTCFSLGAALESAHKEDPKAWSVSADMYYLAGRDTEALERYQKCLALKPKVFSVYENTLTLLDNMGKSEEVMTLSEKAMDVFPNQPKSYLFYGKAANDLNRPSDALASLEPALLMSMANKTLYFDLLTQIGRAHILNKMPEKAIERLDKALPVGGDQHPGILKTYGDALTAQGKTEEARKFYNKIKG